MARPSSASDAGTEAILRALDDADVQYVLIGGKAAQSQGWTQTTQDVDITPRQSAENFERLAVALESIEAGYPDFTTSEGMRPPGGWTAPLIEQAVPFLLLDTAHGPLDLAFRPTGFSGGYDELAQVAERKRVAGTSVTVLTATRDAILRSKTLADRDKDRRQLPRMREDFARDAESELG